MTLSLINLVAVLVAAWTGGALAKRFGYPAVLGEILAGVALGPPLLGLLSGSDALTVLGEVGVLVMMLYIGMELEPGELKRASKGGILAALGGFVTPFVASYALVFFAGAGHMAGIFVGIAAGVTSLATKSRILAELGLLDTRVAHVMMAGALVADTLCLVVFAALLGFVEVGHVDAASLALVGGKASVFFLAAAVVGLWILPRVVDRTRLFERLDRGGRFVVAVGLGLLIAEGAELAGLHGILGAFLAGLFLRRSVVGDEPHDEMVAQVRDVSLGFLAPIFFVTAGFAVSLDVLWTSAWLVLAVIVVATVGKVVGTALFYLPTGHGWREGVTIGVGMNGRGAVEIIVAQIGLAMGVITQEIFSILVIMAIATTATVPVLLRWAASWLQRRGELVRPGKGESAVGGGAGELGGLAT